MMKYASKVAAWVHDRFWPRRTFDYINVETGAGVGAVAEISQTLANECGYILLKNPDWTQDVLDFVKTTTPPQNVNKDYELHEYHAKTEGLLALYLRTGDRWCLDAAAGFMQRFYDVCRTPRNLLHSVFNPVTGVGVGWHFGWNAITSFGLLGRFHDPVWLNRAKSVVMATEALKPATGLIHGFYDADTGAVTMEEWKPMFGDYGEALTVLHKLTGDSYYLERLKALVDAYITYAWDEDRAVFYRVHPSTGVRFPAGEQYIYAWDPTEVVGLIHLYNAGYGETYLNIAERLFESYWQRCRENSLYVNQVYFLSGANNHYSKLHAEPIKAGLELYFTTHDPLYKERCNQYFWQLVDRAKRDHGFPEIRTDTFANYVPGAPANDAQPEYIWESINLMYVINEWSYVFEIIYPETVISLFEIMFTSRR